MPVADHPIHPHGVRDADYRYGCYNRAPFRETCTNGTVTWPHVFTRDCQYDRALDDGACAGCMHAKEQS
jgi:hypothetical protein